MKISATAAVAEPTRGPTRPSRDPVIALRVAQPEDDDDVIRLAQLDDARPPVAPVMLAVVDGEAVAALSLSDGRVVANPFVATEKVVSLLRLRATQLSPERRQGPWARVGQLGRQFRQPCGAAPRAYGAN